MRYGDKKGVMSEPEEWGNGSNLFHGEKQIATLNVCVKCPF